MSKPKRQNDISGSVEQVLRRFGTSSARAALWLINEWMGTITWEKQAQIVEAVFSGPHKRVAVRSCHGVGKTKIAAAIAVAWLLLGPERYVVTTAPTQRQVESLLWQEIRRIVRAMDQKGLAHGLSLPPKACEMARAPAHPDAVESYAWGFSSSQTDNYQGYHARGGVLVIVDEACGVAQGIIEALEGNLTTANDKILFIGNPTQRGTAFHREFSSPLTTKIHISAEDAPNLKYNNDELIHGMVTRRWVDSLITRYGKDSPVVQVRCFGEFPSSDEDVIVKYDDVEASFSLFSQYSDQDDGKLMSSDSVVCVGIDVARTGANATVFAKLHEYNGMRAISFEEYRGLSTTEVSARIDRLVGKCKNIKSVRIDGDGLGAGVVDQCNALREQNGWRCDVVEMRGGKNARDKDRYVNARAEWYWTLREKLTASPRGLAIAESVELAGELPNIRWMQDSRGRIQIESKDAMAKRGMASPDFADALAMVLAPVDNFETVDVEVGAISRLKQPSKWRA